MKLAKAMSMALACAMAATMCATSAFAATSGSTKVNATVTPSYTLTVPESITLTNNKGGSGTYTGTIPVNVKGDIGEGQSVTVTSTAPIMKCSGSKNVTASFTGTPKKSWTRMETSGQGTTDNYGLSAVLTPGVWEGAATSTGKGLPKTASTQLLASATAVYTITVPETVKLTGVDSGPGSYTADITMTLKGDVEENAVIVVSVDGGTMTNTAGKTAAVTVSNQTKSKWSRADLLNDGTSATCKVSAELDPGHWTGTATFSCEKTYK